MKIYLYIIGIIGVFLISCERKTVQKEEHVYYTCSMDPQVMETKPGICPICKMELTKVDNTQQDPKKLHLTQNQIELANIHVIKIRESNLNGTLDLLGKVAVDQEAAKRISSRFEGRIDKLYIKANASYIKKGTLLFEIYSEEIVATQQEYLNFLVELKKDNSANNRLMAESAKHKLLLWGLNENTIRSIEARNQAQKLVPIYSQDEGLIREVFISEGDFVMEGSMLFSLENYSNLWVEAQCNISDIELVIPGQKASISFDAFPGEHASAIVSFVKPELTPQSNITIVRCNLDNSAKKYLPGMKAQISISLNTDSTIVLPVDAVLQGKEGSFVWIQNEDGTFQSKMVETGIQRGNQIEINWGIKPGKKVVVKGTYLLNSEYLLKNGTSPMEGHDMKDM